MPSLLSAKVPMVHQELSVGNGVVVMIIFFGTERPLLELDFGILSSECRSVLATCIIKKYSA